MSNVKPLSGLSGLTPSMERSTKEFWSGLWAVIDSASVNGLTTAQVVGMLEVAKAAVIQSHFDDEE